MLSNQALARIDQAVAQYPADQKQSAVMAALTIVQDEHGHLTSETMDFVAEYLGMPAVAEAVVVAAPDDRLGERTAAVLRIRDGHVMPTLDEVREHFKAAGVAIQKWPEQLHRVDDYPRTASGKVQKFLVRQSISP